MFGMGSNSRTIPPKRVDELVVIQRVLRKHTRILSNLNYDGNESHEAILKALGRLETKVDTAIGDIREYRKQQKDLSGRIALVEEYIHAGQK